MEKTIMLFGLGAVGEFALQILACNEGIDRIITSCRNKALGTFKTNTAAIGATYKRSSTKFEFRENDINDIYATSRLLQESNPEIILLAVSSKSPNYFREIPMPQDVRNLLLSAGFGVQLPWHLLLPMKFMQALEKSGIRAHVINGSFPDVTGPALWKHLGFGPVVGMGNIDLMAAAILTHVSEAEGVPVDKIGLSLISSHAHLVHGSRENVPYFMRIQIGDRDITARYDISQMMRRLGMANGTPADRHIAQRYFNFTIAASAVKNIMAILRDTKEYTHASSPNGLIGGYPVRLSARGAEIILPEQMTLDQAIKINENAERYDGVEKIKDDGTIIYTDKTYSIMKELGYDCKELSFDELEAKGKELEALIEKLKNRT